MLDINDVVSQMRTSLALSDPDLDTSVGTTTRKIIDAVAEAITSASIDSHITSYIYDIDSKIEGDLDSFCSLFGIVRLAAKRASGLVTFSRTTTTSAATIPINTIVGTSDGITVLTLTSGFMPVGQASVTVPVQAVNAGPEGNLPAHSLTFILSDIAGTATVTNASALTGGVNQEDDASLRSRWKQTVFRSIAGTEQMYLGCALNDPDCTSANVVGASKRHKEQVQVIGGVATSTIDDAAYVFAPGVALGYDILSGDLLINGHDYTFNPSNVVSGRVAPSVTINANVPGPKGGGATLNLALEGQVLDLEFDYIPQASRNVISGASILNRVDVWCVGQRPVSAVQNIAFRPSLTFSASSSNQYYTGKFVRPDGTHPTTGNIFIPLAFGPIMSIPDTLSIGGSTYGRVGSGASVTYPNIFNVVHDDTAWGYSPTSLFGLEWSTSHVPTTNTVFVFGENNSYVYNDVPLAVQENIDRWRLAGVDVKAHAAKLKYLKFSLAIIYTKGFIHTDVNSAIDTAISSYLGGLGLGSIVQYSDVLNIVHNVPGVDAVRFLTPQDFGISSFTQVNMNADHIGIQEMIGNTTNYTWADSNGIIIDAKYGDSEAPVLYSVIKSTRAQNTFSSYIGG